MTAWTKTLGWQLAHELDSAIERVAEMKASGPYLEALNDLLERLERAREIYRQIEDRLT